MENKSVLLQIESGVATILLNEPQKLNALSSSLVEDFKTVLKRIQQDSDIRSVVLTGNGGILCRRRFK